MTKNNLSVKKRSIIRRWNIWKYKKRRIINIIFINACRSIIWRWIFQEKCQTTNNIPAKKHLDHKNTKCSKKTKKNPAMKILETIQNDGYIFMPGEVSSCDECYRIVFKPKNNDKKLCWVAKQRRWNVLEPKQRRTFSTNNYPRTKPHWLIMSLWWYICASSIFRITWFYSKSLDRTKGP